MRGEKPLAPRVQSTTVMTPQLLIIACVRPLHKALSLDAKNPGKCCTDTSSIRMSAVKCGMLNVNENELTAASGQTCGREQA